MKKKKIVYGVTFFTICASIYETNASSGRKGFGQVTSSLSAKADETKQDAEKIRAERDFLDKQKAIMDAENQSRFDLEKKYDDETGSNHENFLNEKGRLSVLDSAGDTMFPTIDDEDAEFNQLINQFHAEKAKVEAKEASVQKINVTLADGKVLKIRRDVLELSPLLKLILEDADLKKRDTVPLPDHVKPEVAKKLFDYLESKLTPGLKKDGFFVPVESKDDVLTFLKNNIDILNALNFLCIAPNFNLKLNSRDHFIYTHLEKGNEHPRHLLEGYSYDMYAPATAENISYFVGHDIISALSIDPSLMVHYGNPIPSFSVSSIDDVNFILSNISDILQQYSHHIQFKAPYSAFDLSKDEILGLLKKEYELDVLDENSSLSANKEKLKENLLIPELQSYGFAWLKDYSNFKDGYLKDILYNYILSKTEISTYYLKGVDHLPDDLLEHIRRVGKVSVADPLQMLKELPDDATQGGNIINEIVYNKLKEIKLINLANLEELKLIHKIPDFIAKDIIIDCFWPETSNAFSYRDNNILRALKEKNPEKQAETKDLIKKILIKGFSLKVSSIPSYQHSDESGKLKDLTSFILDLMENFDVNSQELIIFAAEMTDDDLMRLSRLLPKIKGLKKVTLRPKNAENIKVIVSSLPGSVQELVVSDYFYHEQNDPKRLLFTEPGKSKEQIAKEKDKKIEDYIYNMINETAQFSGKKTFISSFQGLESYGGSYNYYPFDDLKRRVKRFESSSFVINLKQRQLHR